MNLGQISLSRPDSGLGLNLFSAKVFKLIQGVPSRLEEISNMSCRWKKVYRFQTVDDVCENNFFTSIRSRSGVGSYLRLINFLYHSTLGMRVIKKIPFSDG